MGSQAGLHLGRRGCLEHTNKSICSQCHVMHGGILTRRVGSTRPHVQGFLLPGLRRSQRWSRRTPRTRPQPLQAAPWGAHAALLTPLREGASGSPVGQTRATAQVRASSRRHGAGVQSLLEVREYTTLIDFSFCSFRSQMVVEGGSGASGDSM